jgi:hypothetical protein
MFGTESEEAEKFIEDRLPALSLARAKPKYSSSCSCVKELRSTFSPLQKMWVSNSSSGLSDLIAKTALAEHNIKVMLNKILKKLRIYTLPF